MVGALIARTDGEIPDLRDLEYDTLFGPTDDMVSHRLPDRGCVCQRDKQLIEQVIAIRST
jgi:hypothetical protein